MASLELAMPFLLVNEGGYSEPPMDDQPTKYGIIAVDIAKHRHVPVDQVTRDVIKNLTLMEATEIYREQYWNPMSLDGVKDQNVATAIFDVGVLRGIRIGGLYTQDILKMLGAGILADGIIGPKTLAALNIVSRSEFIELLCLKSEAGFLEIIVNIPSRAQFARGWMNRAKRLLTLA